jgi:hypothetical protein
LKPFGRATSLHLGEHAVTRLRHMLAVRQETSAARLG